MNTSTKSKTDRTDFGTEPNMLTIAVTEMNIEAVRKYRQGELVNGFLLQLHQYDLNSVLCQLIEDYGQETLIERINSL